MHYTIPDYYEAFSCTADACEDTCCAGWQIVVDEEALERYRAEKGPYRKKLREAVCWRDGTFRQDPLCSHKHAWIGNNQGVRRNVFQLVKIRFHSG